MVADFFLIWQCVIKNQIVLPRVVCLFIIIVDIGVVVGDWSLGMAFRFDVDVFVPFSLTIA